MTRKVEAPPPSRYMNLDEVAHQLGYKSRRPAYDLIAAGKLEAVTVSATGRAGTRVTRASFDAYCAAVEAAAARQRAADKNAVARLAASA